MHETKVETSTESQPIDAPLRGAKSKSSFNDAEYQRWSESLRNRGNSKNK